MNIVISQIFINKNNLDVSQTTFSNNKNIFIDANSEIPKSERIQDKYVKVHNKKITQILIAKTK